MARKTILIAVSIGIVATGGLLAAYILSNMKQNADGSNSAGKSLIAQTTLDSLEKVDRSKADVSRLADGLAPPTNTWFSGLALQNPPEAAFSYPNSVRPTNNGLELGLPTVSATADTIIGPHVPDVIITIDQAANYKVMDYDELTVTLGYFAANDEQIATITLAAGSPYVFVTAQDDTSVKYTGSAKQRDDALAITSNGKLYGVRAEDKAVDGPIRLAAGATASFFSAPDEAAFSTLASMAPNVITAGSVDYEQRGEKSVTSLNYTTSNGKPTLITRLPHQNDSEQPLTSVQYDSVLGTLATTAAGSIEYAVASVSTDKELPLDGISDDQRDALLDQLKKDITSLPEDKEDTYFGGKQLQRMAQLLVLANQLDARQQKETLKTILSQRLDRWLATNGAFQFDTKAQTIVGKQTGFGADTDVNDHHFHYGYAIYAAAVLARFDDSFIAQHGAVVDLLVADVANYKAGETLPQRRNFDAYFGHSWASGTAPFRDGNNQESTSEAINAWTAVALWGQRSNNDTLTDQAKWMLANETATAKEYWLKKPTIPGYTAPIASIVWGGKREYKTFFSDEANPKLAILLLPLNPSMREYASSLSDASFTGTDISKPFGDYLLMAQPNATLEQARALPDSSIDDGNSRTYLYAYIMAKR